MGVDKGRALIFAPTYAGKAYCLDEWIAGCRAQTYEDKSIYTVDNSRGTLAYFKKIEATGVSCTHLEPWPDWDRTFRRSWELGLERAKEIGAYWFFSVESDNVPAPEALEVMINIALYGKLHLVTHDYPMHATAAKASGMREDSWYYRELGCLLATVSLIERAIDEFDENGGNIAASIFTSNQRYHGGQCNLTNRFEVLHLDGYEMSYPNLGPSEIPGLMMPTPQMPADYGTVDPLAAL